MEEEEEEEESVEDEISQSEDEDLDSNRILDFFDVQRQQVEGRVAITSNKEFDAALLQLNEGKSSKDEVVARVDTLLQTTTDPARHFKVIMVELNLLFHTAQSDARGMLRRRWRRAMIDIVRLIRLIMTHENLHDAVDAISSHSHNAESRSEEFIHRALVLLQQHLIHTLTVTPLGVEYRDRLIDEMMMHEVIRCALWMYLRMKESVIEMSEEECANATIKISREDRIKALNVAIAAIASLHLNLIYHKNQSILKREFAISGKLLLKSEIPLPSTEQEECEYTILRNQQGEKTLGMGMVVTEPVPCAHPLRDYFNVDVHPCMKEGLFSTELAQFVYKYGDDDLRIKTVLAHIYNTAMNGDFYKARRMLLQTRIQDTIASAPHLIQALLNHVIVQIAFAAFRKGLFSEVQRSCLNELCFGTSRALRVNLGQQRGNKNEEEEGYRSYGYIPLHLRINENLVDTVFTLSCMFSEATSIANAYIQGPIDELMYAQRPVQRIIQRVERCAVQATEVDGDCIGSALGLLLEGKWKKAVNTAMFFGGWNEMPNNGWIDGCSSLRELLTYGFKISALQISIVTRMHQYTSFKLSSLCVEFDLSEDEVRRKINQMLMIHKVRGSWDENVFILCKPSSSIKESSKNLLMKLAKESKTVVKK
ncbi:Eukaryotic translation initiation factor 3 subunit C like protein [Aduncisulcus paluster]|uniref:Eukaryotic translation initiation factor 3 subunit C like protein n=1 Tax=Aduncisulcus paluster TaxID=2918883 RepID=A0ABQ5K4R8_9EUKA|nr:Eukaryotic translation initiation factor 3 subunit C like protein [Aduncisulcus paluster]